LILSREFEFRSREFGALPEIPTRRDLVGRRARLAAAALAGAAAASPASVHNAFDDVRLAPQFESPPSTQSPSSTQVGKNGWRWPAGNISGPILPDGGFATSSRHRLSVAERVLDQFPADGAEENNLYCNPAPNGDKRHADLRPDLDHEPAGFTRSSVPFPCQRRRTQPSKPAEPMILCAPCDKIQSGDGRVANIGGIPAEPSAPGIAPLRRCRRIGEAR
jgi:hypothetical protein